MKTDEYNKKQILIPYLEKMNLNNRIYTKEAAQKIVDMFNSRSMPGFGQIGYPDGSSFDVSLTKASHFFKNLKLENDQVVGDLEILKTDEGEKLKSMLKQGVFRPRIIGTVNENNEVIVEKIIAFDFVMKDTDAFNE